MKKNLKKNGIVIGICTMATATTPWVASLNDVVIDDEITYVNEKAYEGAITSGISCGKDKKKHLNKTDTKILVNTIKWSESQKEGKQEIKDFRKYLKNKTDKNLFTIDDLDEIDIALKLGIIPLKNIKATINETASIEKSFVSEK